MSAELFIKATRYNFRYPSPNGSGSLTTEDLWSYNLESLREIMRKISVSVKQVSDDFIEGVDDESRKETAEMVRSREILEVVKYIFIVKKNDIESAKKKKERKMRRQQLADILAKRNEESTNQMSTEEIMAELEKLDD